MPGEYLKSEGDFLVVASKPNSGWLGQSKEKKTPYVQIRFTVEDGVDAGKEITWFGFLSDKAIENTVDALVAAFGFNGDLNALHFGQTTFDNMRARITVVAEDYEGKPRHKVKWLNPEQYSGPQSMDDDSARMLIAGLNKKTMAAAKMCQNANGKVSAEKPMEAKAIAETADDVPF